MIDRLAYLSNSVMYIICTPDWKIVEGNNYFKRTLDSFIGSSLLDMVSSKDLHKFNSPITKGKNMDVLIKTKGLNFEMFEITLDHFFGKFIHLLGVLRVDTPQQLREDQQRLKRLRKEIQHHINHELLAIKSRIEGGLNLLEMATTDEDRKKAIHIITNETQVLHESLINAANQYK